MKSRCSGGFALPSVLIASIIMLTVLLAAVTSTAAVRVSLVSQYYNQLSRVAGDAGIVYAKACLEANNGVAQWSNAKPLKPDTDCTGTQLSSCPVSPADAACHSLTNSNNILTTFTVDLPQLYPDGAAKNVTANGITSLLRTSDGSVWRQYNQSSKFSLTGLYALGAPTNLVATGGVTQVSLTWTAPTDNGGSAITGYKLYRSTTTGPTTLVQTLGNVTSYVDTGLADVTKYYFRIKAVNANGDSPYSVETNATTLSNLVNLTFNPTSTGRSGTIQTWTVPSNSTYTIEVWGAQGGSSPTAGGLGARMRGDFVLTAGAVLKILVGQQGVSSTSRGGGGGGSFVTTNSNSPLIIAGGGGGAANNNAGVGGVTTTGGTIGSPGTGSAKGNPGTNGGGGGGGVAGAGGGGGGLLGNGGGGCIGVYSGVGGAGGNAVAGSNGTGGTCYAESGGLSFVNGGTGGYYSFDGGFGGGGGVISWNYSGGGGGGYSGGGGGAYTYDGDTLHIGGGGGGSYNSGTNQSNTASARSGQGLVTIHN